VYIFLVIRYLGGQYLPMEAAVQRLLFKERADPLMPILHEEVNAGRLSIDQAAFKETGSTGI
jgi:hypothetical protein